MTTAYDKTRAYKEVHALMKQHGGTMTYKPLGKGGVWYLKLHGKKLDVKVPNQNATKLEQLYVPKGPNPKVWADYTNTLIENPFWTLVDLFLSKE